MGKLTDIPLGSACSKQSKEEVSIMNVRSAKPSPQTSVYAVNDCTSTVSADSRHTPDKQQLHSLKTERRKGLQEPRSWVPSTLCP